MGKVDADYLAAGQKAARVCTPLLGSLDDAEDCAAEAVLEALQRQDKMAQVDCVESWIVTIAKRRAFDLVRRREAERRRFDKLAVVAAREVQSPDPAIEELLDRAEASWLHSESRALPPATQAALAKVMEGMSPAEAAISLGLSKRAVENHLFRARQQLRARWLKSIAAVTGLLTVGRRLGRPSMAKPVAAASAVSIALPLAVLVGVAPHGHHHDQVASAPAVSPLHVVARIITVRHPAGVRTNPRSRTQVHVVGSTSTTHVVTSVTPAPGTSVKVIRGDNGKPSSGPVDTIKQCLADFHLSVDYIGCGPS